VLRGRKRRAKWAPQSGPSSTLCSLPYARAPSSPGPQASARSPWIHFACAASDAEGVVHREKFHRHRWGGYCA
jgi:hypothetical protein